MKLKKEVLTRINFDVQYYTIGKKKKERTYNFLVTQLMLQLLSKLIKTKLFQRTQNSTIHK